MKNISYPPCPKCGGPLRVTSTESLWCWNNCYESEFELWEVLLMKENNNENQNKRENSTKMAKKKRMENLQNGIGDWSRKAQLFP